MLMNKYRRYIFPLAPVIVIGSLYGFGFIDFDTAFIFLSLIEFGIIIYLSWKEV